MSKLESAFSKALREQGSAKSYDVDKSKSGSSVSSELQSARHFGSEITVSSGGVNRNLVTTKSQIRKMVYKDTMSDGELAKKRIIYPRMKDKRLLNIYRNLRTKLLATSKGSNFTTLVTSVVPGGDDSLIAANIAATFAFDEGKTSLLIEGNVFNHSLSNLFNIDKTSKGLMDCLESEEMSVVDILVETGIPRLRFIPSGVARENSSEYFTSEKMRHLIGEISERYPERYPIIEAPGISESADARILLELCDRVVLIIPYGLCSEDDIKNAVNIIGREKLVGVVLNQF